MNRITIPGFQLAIYAQGNPDAKKLALVLPGRLDTKDYVHMKSHVDFLAGRDFFALSFDPPGTWESSGSIELFSTSNYLKAVNELIEYFGAKPTLLLGHSRGGTVAMLGSQNPVVEAVALVMATYGKPSSPKPEALASGIQIEKRDLPPGGRREGEQKTYNLPISYFEDAKRHNPVAVLEKCTIPKLLIYGTEDEFTTVSRVREVFANIPEPKMLHKLNTDHDYRYYPEAIKELNVVVGKFLDKFISE